MKAPKLSTETAIEQMLEHMWLKRTNPVPGKPDCDILTLKDAMPPHLTTLVDDELEALDMLKLIPLQMQPIAQAEMNELMAFDVQYIEDGKAMQMDFILAKPGFENSTLRLNLSEEGVSLRIFEPNRIPIPTLDITGSSRIYKHADYQLHLRKIAASIGRTTIPSNKMRSTIALRLATKAMVIQIAKALSNPSAKAQQVPRRPSPRLHQHLRAIEAYEAALIAITITSKAENPDPLKVGGYLELLSTLRIFSWEAARFAVDRYHPDRPILLARPTANDPKKTHLPKGGITIKIDPNCNFSKRDIPTRNIPMHKIATLFLQGERDFPAVPNIFAPLRNETIDWNVLEPIDVYEIIHDMRASLR